MNKKGSEWTVSKLVSLILLVIVVVLVIVGVSTGALNPLGKKLKDIFNSVLAFFGKKETGITQLENKIECKILGKMRTGQINYDAEWCKVDLEPALGSYGIFGGKFSQNTSVFVSKVSGASDLYFRYSRIINVWQWSPDKVNWVSVPEAKYLGNTPVKQNVYIISKLNGKNYDDGEKEFWNAPKTLGTVSKEFTNIEKEVLAISGVKSLSPTLEIWESDLNSQSNYLFSDGAWGNSLVYLSKDEQINFDKGFDRIIGTAFLGNSNKIAILSEGNRLYEKTLTSDIKNSAEERSKIIEDVRKIMKDNTKQPLGSQLVQIKQELVNCCGLS